MDNGVVNNIVGAQFNAALAFVIFCFYLFSVTLKFSITIQHHVNFLSRRHSPVKNTVAAKIFRMSHKARKKNG